MKYILLVSAAFAIAGCKTQEVESETEIVSDNSQPTEQVTEIEQKPMEPVQEPPTDLLSMIKQQAKSETCQTKSDCAVVAIGHRACGGPESYMVYSKVSSDQEKLESLASQYQQQRQVANKKSGMMSICKMEQPPEFACQSNQCVVANASGQTDI